MKLRRLVVALCGLAVVSAYSAAPLAPVAAVDILRPVCNTSSAGGQPAVCQDNQSNNPDNPLIGPRGVLTNYIRILSFAVGVAAVIAIMVGGLRFITANGNQQTVSTAQKTVVYALGALLVAGLAQLMVFVVLSRI